MPCKSRFLNHITIPYFKPIAPCISAPDYGASRPEVGRDQVLSRWPKTAFATEPQWVSALLGNAPWRKNSDGDAGSSLR